MMARSPRMGVLNVRSEYDLCPTLSSLREPVWLSLTTFAEV